MANKDLKTPVDKRTGPQKPVAQRQTVTRTPLARTNASSSKPAAAQKPTVATAKKVENPSSITERVAQANRSRRAPDVKQAAGAPSAKPTATQSSKPIGATSAKTSSTSSQSSAPQTSSSAIKRTPISRSAPISSAQTDTAAPRAAANGDAAKSVRSSARPSARSVPPQHTARRAEVAATEDGKKVAAMTDTTKPERATSSKQSATRKSGGPRGGAAVAANRTRIMIITVIVCVLVLGAVLGIIFGVRSCDGGPAKNDKPFKIQTPTSGVFNSSGELKPGDPYENVTVGNENLYAAATDDYEYDEQKVTNTAVGYYGKVIGSVERVVPQKTRDEGLGVYPKYGYTLSTVIGSGADQVRGRNELIAESSYLTATGTANAGGGNYKWMDKDGYLYNGTTAEPQASLDKKGKPRRLYKHSASVGLYMGDVSPEEPGIIKRVTMRPRGYSGYGVTGVYAPAGEVIKIQLTEADMNATGGIVIHIGQALYNGQANNIWTAKGQMQRIPHLLNTMVVDKNTSVFDTDTGLYTAYVGSFIGGPLYIRNEGVTFTATISGGVAYSHFILGYTTEEEFNENANTSAPYFDLEVWHNGVLHSGPKTCAAGLSYDAIYKAAVLWDKVASVTTTGSSQGIVFLYDPFVAAGAAVAFPGRRSVNCPAGWMRASLNYDGLVASGSWGNFHEYHHNFQGYGVGNGGEVTNNGMTLVSYALFTKISANRGIGGYGSQGLGGWNSYTSATWALSEVLKIAQGGEPSNGKQGLTLYSTLLHNLGADNYIQSKVRQQSQGYGQSYMGYLKAWQDVTHNDMTYFFKDVLCGIDDATAATNKENIKDLDYPVFVPVSSVYQTGRSYMYDGQKKYITTMQPFVIPYGKATTVDLDRYSAPNGQYNSGSIVLPDGFSYTVKSVGTPQNGTLELIEGNKYRYTPDGVKRSGKITVTLGITKDDGAFEVDDVDLVLEFQPSQEATKMEIKRTTYTFGGETKYSDARQAYEAGYAGNTDKSEIVQSNPVQNCNTDIWYYADTAENRQNYPDAPEHFFAPSENTVAELSGKLYIQSEGKYRVYLRGRTNCAFYYSTDGGLTYSLGGYITSGTGAGFRLNDPNTYVDVEMPADSWIYFKSVLIANGTGNTVSFMGLGLAQWTAPMFTMVEKHYDKNGNEVASTDDKNYHHTETHYYDYRGNEVTEEEANNAALIPPTGGSPYVNAYRIDYEHIVTPFESEYFYTRNYAYTYSETATDLDQSYVGDDPCPSNFPISNLFDGDLTTACSSKALVTADAPWTLFIDLGKSIEANRCVITGYLYGAGKNQTPNSFTLYVGETQDDLHEAATFENCKVNGVTVQFNIENQSFRYYKLVVTHTVEGRFAAIANIAFSHSFTGEQIVPDDDMFTYGGTWTAKSTLSTFGHVYVGEKDATVSFTFEGTRLCLLSAAAYGGAFKVEIDGVVLPTEQIKAAGGSTCPTYISPALDGGSHTVTITCVGESSIDSIVLCK